MSTNQNRDRGIPEDELEPGDEYGWTFGLDSSGDLKINEKKNLSRRYDVDAVIQDLKIALMTVEGEDPMREDYGLDIFEAAGTSFDRLRAEIGRTIGPNQDPRVQRVNEVNFIRDSGDREGVEVEVTVTLRDGTMESFSFDPGMRVRR